MKQVIIRILLLSALLLSGALVGFAQTAEVTGIVRDASQAVVNNATLTLANEDTGIKRTATTNELGIYRFALVPPGNYKLTVQMKGFQTANRPGIKLEVAQIAQLPTELGRNCNALL